MAALSRATSRFLDVLEAMGCTVREEPDGTSVPGPLAPGGITVDMGDISDTFMTLAAVAPVRRRRR